MTNYVSESLRKTKKMLNDEEYFTDMLTQNRQGGGKK
jgi:hypothetical protein